MFRVVAVLVLFGGVAFATPVAGPELPVDATLGSEFINAYHFDVRLDVVADRWVLSWTDNRGEVGGTWLAIYDGDGGVVVPGNRALASAYDFTAHGPRAMCPRSDGSWLWVLREAWSSRISVIATSRDGLRISRESFDAPGLTVPQALTCPNDVPLWLTARNSMTQGQFALEVRRVDDGGTLELDGGVLREELDVTDEQFDYGFTAGASTAWWTQGGTDGLDLYAAPVSADGVGSAVLIAGGPGHQTAASFAGAEAVWTEQLIDGGPRDVRTSFRMAPLAATPLDEDLPQLVFDGNQHLAAWRAQLAPYDYELRLAPIASNGMYGPTTTLYRGWFDELHLASPGNGTTMVAFRDFSRGIHAVTYLLDGVVPRATADGGPFDPGITALSQTRNLFTPMGDGRHLLSWAQEGRRLFRLLGGDAGISDLALNQSDVKLASNGAALVAVDFAGEAQVIDAISLQAAMPFRWTTEFVSALSTPVWDGTRFWFLSVLGNAKQLVLQAVKPSSFVNTPQPIALGAEDAELALTASGNMVIAWSRTREVHVACRDLNTGNVRELVTAGAAYLPLPRVASSGEASLVVFLADLPTGLGLDAFLIDRDCTVAQRLSLGATDWWSRLDTYVSTVEWDGAEFIVAWLPTSSDRNGDLAITAIDEAGTVRGPFPIAAVPNAPELEPSLTVEGPGRWWLSYQRFDAKESISTRRAFYRLVVDDAGVRVDAGVVANDGGATFDAGTTDGGGATPDAGSFAPDGGTPETPHRTLAVGCGCSSDGAALLVLALGLVSRRRTSTPGPSL